MRERLLLLLICLCSSSCSTTSDEPSPSTASSPAIGVPIRAPLAPVRPTRLEAHGQVRVDDYYWMREREDPTVLAHLEQENAYTAQVLAPTAALQEELYQELVDRIQEDDATVPARDGEYGYYTRFEQGRPYPLHCRAGLGADGVEQILLDVNAMAEGHAFYAVSGLSASPDHERIAYAVDTRGRRIYDIEVKDLASGSVTDRIEAVSGNLVWAEDSRHLFYTRREPETLRSYQVWRHALGTEVEADELVFQEDDETFSCSVSKTNSKRFLTIASRHTLTNEVRILDATKPLGEWRIVLPRERGHEYQVEHWGDTLLLRTNRAAKNFRVVRAPLDDFTRWQEVIPHREDVFIERVAPFARHLVVTERAAGLRRLRILNVASGVEHFVEFPDPAYAVSVGTNREFDTDVLRFTYSSLKTPRTVYDYGMDERTLDLKKRDVIEGGFDSDDYESERLWATARDGTRVPISLVFRAPLERDGARPLLLYAYGSYGASMDARFSPNTVSLLDRNFVYAIAHVRGGQELGREWYEDGKLLKKKNTFTDFVDCAEHLVDSGYTSPERLCAMGGSAGGLLMGAIANSRPDLFRAIVAAVPFVDVVTTMLDATIPLTTFEWDEWGDPRDREYYEYMLSYSPYDQVQAQAYPDLLVTSGLHDSQVQYWEPAKWVAKLRALKTDQNRLLFKCALEAGHGGVSGRYERLREQALTYAFLLTAVE